MNEKAMKRIIATIVLWQRAAIAALLGLGFLLLYLITLAPDIMATDSGEWQATAATLGISHPPGSPAYNLVGWFFTQIPFGSLPERMSLLSAVVGAASVVAIYYLMAMLLDSLIPAIVASATLGLSAYWWSFSSVTQPYTSVIFMIIILLILLLIWHRKGAMWVLWLGAFIIGFGIAYHLYILYFLPSALVGVFALGPWRKIFTIRNCAVILLLFILGLSFLLYLPIRAADDPLIAHPAKIDSISSFIGFITARETREGKLRPFDIGAFKDNYLLVIRKSFYPSFAFLVYSPFLLLLYPKVRAELRGIRRYAVFLAFAAVLQIIFIFLSTSGYTQYYIAMLMYFAILSGFSIYLMLLGGKTMLTGKYESIPMLITVLIYSVILIMGVPKVWDFVDHSHDVSMREYADEVFRIAEPNAVVLAHWETYSGLIYAQKIDGERPDLDIRFINEDWKDAQVEKINGEYPQVLLSYTLPGENLPGDEMKYLNKKSDYYYMSQKGRTYQDRSHGEPYPAAVQLFEIKMNEL